MKLLRFFFFTILFCCAYKTRAQNFLFETLNTRSGLSSNEVNCIYEDHNHFLWIGTRDGLNRFDGRVFKTFRNNPEDTNSISGNNIVSIIQDSQNIFWIATKDGGLTRYDANAPSGKEFRQFKNNPKNPNSIATNRLNCLYDWDENYLLIGAEVYPGIFLNKKTFEFTYWNYNTQKFHPRFGTPHPTGTMNWIHCIKQGDGNNIYFSVLLSGNLFKADKQTGNLQKIHSGSNDVLSIGDFFTEGKKIWMACWNPGLFLQPDMKDSATQKNVRIDDLLNCVSNLNKNFLLAGTRASGLYVVNKATGEVETYRKNIANARALPSNKVNCILVDSRNIVWIGTSSGLAKYDKTSWMFDEKEFADPATDCTVLHCYQFNNGSVAVNTSKGMFLSDEFQMDFRNIRFSNRGKEIIPDYLLPLDEEEFLLGTENSFYRWKKNSAQLKEVSVPKFNLYQQGVFQVKEMLYDSVQGQHGAWMAVLGYGLCFYSFDDGSFYEYINDNKNFKSIGSNLARRLERDKNGNIWVATASGLYMRSPKTLWLQNIFTSYTNEPDNPNSLPNNDVTDIWCNRDNHLWLTMNGGGLAEFDGKKFIQYVPEDPLSSRVFLGMHIDKRNRIWIITKNGLEVFDIQQKKFFHVDINDGIANTNLSTHFSNEVNGIVNFTAGNLLYNFEPDKMNFSINFPNQYLTDMEVYDKNYLNDALHGVVKLKSRERYINFTVSALQFTSPHSVRFQYKLDGLEETWTNSNDGVIKYTNLPWGSFKLLVRVTNPSGQFGAEKMLAEFNIATPFYYTWWFILTVLLLIAASGYAFYRYRIAQLMKLQSIRNKIARDLHDDIGSTLGSISVFSEAAKQLLEQNKAERAQNMLEKIGDTSREMIDNMSDIVWSVNPKNDTAKYLVERMRVFAGDLVASSEIQLHFNTAQSVEDTKLTMEQRKNIFLIFKETVYNTVKYSGGSNLYIEIKRNQQNLLLTIKDDGKGFDVNNYKSKNGNGIKNMRYRAEEIGVKFNIESSSQGTITTVII